MLRKTVVAIAALLSLVTFASAQQPRPIAPIEFEKETLDNGLRVVYAPLKQAPVVHVRVLYNVGSYDERPDRQGFAHMFEHMMFRGSAHVKPEEHMKLINGVGGISNAFTSFNQTTYVNTVPAEHLEMALWLEADRMASFKVSDDIYRTERKVVAEEWRMRMNQPYGNMYELFLKNAFEKSHYNWTPIGNMEHLAKAAAGELQAFFNTYYVPNNAVLVIAGDIDIAQARAGVRKYYAWIPRAADPARLSPAEPAQTQERRVVVPANVPLPAVLVAAKTGPYTSADTDALGLLAEILGGGASSRLSRRLVACETPLCTNSQALFSQFQAAGIFGASGMLLSGKNPDEVEKILKEELATLARDGVTQEELDKAKAQYRQEVVVNRKTAEQIARNLGEEWLWAGDPARANRELERTLALTAQDLKAVARKYLKPEALTVMQMVPDLSGPKKPAATQAAGADGAASAPPVAPRVSEFPKDYPTAAPIAEPRTTAAFAKGTEAAVGPAKVVVMTDHRLPISTVIVAIRRGAHSEPAGKQGVASLTAAMLRRGAGGMTYEELNQQLDRRAITISVTDEGDYTQFVASCPSEQLDEAMKLGRLILRQPNFDENEYKKLKTQSLSSLMRSLASPTKVADDQLKSLLFGDSPVGRYVTPKSLASVTLDDVKDYYAKIYRPRDAVMIVAGDITLEQGQTVAKSLLDGWTGELIPAPGYDLPPAAAKRQIVLVDNAQGQQATVRMAIPAYTVQSDEKYAGALANQILSGGIEARVMRYVRAEKGLAYHASGIFTPGRQFGIFSGRTDTASESVADAIEAMFKVFTDMRNAPVTDAELRDAKRRVTGMLVMGMQTIEQQADRRLAGILNNYPADYYDRYAANIAKVTVRQVQDVMKKYVDCGAMSVIVVAPESKSKAALSRLGTVEVKPMPAGK